MSRNIIDTIPEEVFEQNAKDISTKLMDRLDELVEEHSEYITDTYCFDISKQQRVLNYVDAELKRCIMTHVINIIGKSAN